MAVVKGKPNGTLPLGRGLYLQSRAARMTQVSSRSLFYWSKTYLVEPHIHGRNGGPPVYSYNDLLATRAVVRLRAANMPLQRIRKAIKYLYKVLGRGGEWWNLKMVVAAKRDLIVVIPREQSPSGFEEKVVASREGQKVFELAIADLISDLLEGGKLEPFPEVKGHISINGAVQGGAPVIKGTRIPTSVIYQWYKRGLKMGQIAEFYDGLDRVNIEAAIKYESALTK